MSKKIEDAPPENERAWTVWEDTIAIMKIIAADEELDWRILAAMYKSDPRPHPDAISLRVREYCVLVKKFQYWYTAFTER